VGRNKFKAPKRNQGQKVQVREQAGQHAPGGHDDWFYRQFQISLRRLDFEGPFGWGRASLEELQAALRRLKEFEALTWREILNEQGKQNHRLERKEICADAQTRLEEIGLGDSEYVYSLRVTKKHRVWGIRDARDGVTFVVLWCDPDHQVYPMNIKDN
jgi:hypothetical protein